MSKKYFPGIVLFGNPPVFSPPQYAAHENAQFGFIPGDPIEGNLAPSSGSSEGGKQPFPPSLISFWVTILFPPSPGDYATMILNAWRGIEDFDYDCRTQTALKELGF